jgi:hypothetical protein
VSAASSRQRKKSLLCCSFKPYCVVFLWSGALELHSLCFEQICHIAPSLRLFVPNSLLAYCHFFFLKGCAWIANRHTAICSFLRAVLARSVIGLTFLPLAQFSLWLLFNCSRCSLLKATHPERFPHKVPVSPSLSPSSSFTDLWGQQFREQSVLQHPWLLICC